MGKRSGLALVAAASVVGLAGCAGWPSLHEPQPEAPESVKHDVSASDEDMYFGIDPVLEAPMTPDEIEPHLAAAYEGLFATLMGIRAEETRVGELLLYATDAVASHQLLVFGSSIPDDYTVEGRWVVVNVDVPNEWVGGTAVVAHVCLDDSDIVVRDERGHPEERVDTSTLDSSTVLFELSPDGRRFLVADILPPFPDVPNPCEGF